MHKSELPAKNDSTVYWLMQISLDDRHLVSDYFDQLSSESPSNTVGYNDREADSEDLRKLFFDEMKAGDQIIVLRGSNEVICLAEIIGEALQTPADEMSEQDRFKYSRSVSIRHKFEFPFRTIAHLDGLSIMRASSNRNGQLLAKEVMEAVDGDGFTVDWSHLVSLY